MGLSAQRCRPLLEGGWLTPIDGAEATRFTSMIRLIPVIDLQGGRVVRGVGGRRDEYRPVVSRLTDSAEPLAVARAFRDAFEVDEVYIADLDAIAGRPPACPLYATLAREGMALWVDAGIVRAADAACLTGAGVGRVVAGLE